MNKKNIHIYICTYVYICLLIYVYKIPIHLAGPGLRLFQPVWSFPQDLVGRAAKMIAAGKVGGGAGDCGRQSRVAGHTGVSVAVAVVMAQQQERQELLTVLDPKPPKLKRSRIATQ